MNLTIAIVCIILAFGLGVLTVFFGYWLLGYAIPWIKNKLWERFENKVIFVVKKNFDKPKYLNEKDLEEWKKH